ncbi:MAG: hypothetical protein ABSC30_02980 [Acidimicrobiales bacterium]|jgi:hypothetical protein
MHIQLGDVATWVGSAVTVGVLSVVVWQLGMLRKERESRQAASVSAWITDRQMSFPPKDRPNPTVRVEVSLRNVSSQPIGRVLFQVTLGSEHRRMSVGPVPPDGSVTAETAIFRSIAIKDANSSPELDIWFTDEAGHAWHRPHAGSLRQSRPPRDWLELRFSVAEPPSQKQVALVGQAVGADPDPDETPETMGPSSDELWLASVDERSA